MRTPPRNAGRLPLGWRLIYVYRRDFLNLIGAAGVTQALFSPLAACAAGPRDPILVVISQTGGCDLLNTMLELRQYGRYHDLRKPASAPYDAMLNLAIPQVRLAQTTFGDAPDSNAPRYAFHPNMTALRELYRQGLIAVIPGIGIPQNEPNRLSHESARFDWHTATLGLLGEDIDGWIARALDDAPSADLPPMVSTAAPLPRLFTSSARRALAIGPTLEGFAVPSEMMDAVSAYGANANDGAAVSAFNAAVRVKNAAARIGEVAQQYPASAYSTDENNDLDTQLKTIARLIESGRGVRAYFAAQDGYDTHLEQNRTHPQLLAAFSSAIVKFHRHLERIGKADRVLIATFTDFGRRAGSDGNFGTDHGTASMSLLIGARVRGGVYGEYPDLRKLDDDRNVAITVDFRRQLATMAQFMQFDTSNSIGSSVRSLSCIA